MNRFIILIRISIFFLFIIVFGCDYNSIEISTIESTVTNPTPTKENNIVSSISPTYTISITAPLVPTYTPISEVSPTPFITSTANCEIDHEMPTDDAYAIDEFGIEFLNTDTLIGSIFFWDYSLPYGTIDLENETVNVRLLTKPSSKDVLFPGIDLAFSNYSDQVAYLAKGDRLELWVADVNFCEPEIVWLDEYSWLGDVWSYEDVNIKWGPNDQFIILESNLMEGKIVVHSLATNETEQWDGKCNIVGNLPGYNYPATICLVDEDNSDNYVLLDWNGLTQTITNQFETIEGNMLNWVYSKDGKNLLYSDNQNHVIVLDKEFKKNELPLLYTPNHPYDIRQGLRWSVDGNRVLVYGYDYERKLCSKIASDRIDSDNIDVPCWFAIDLSTGETNWWPNNNLDELMNQPNEMLFTNTDAVFSPNGQWIAMNIEAKDLAMNYFIISSFNGEQTLVFDSDIWKGTVLSWKHTK